MMWTSAARWRRKNLCLFSQVINKTITSHHWTVTILNRVEVFIKAMEMKGQTEDTNYRGCCWVEELAADELWHGAFFHWRWSGKVEKLLWKAYKPQKATPLICRSLTIWKASTTSCCWFDVCFSTVSISIKIKDGPIKMLATCYANSNFFFNWGSEFLILGLLEGSNRDLRKMTIS